MTKTEPLHYLITIKPGEAMYSNVYRCADHNNNFGMCIPAHYVRTLFRHHPLVAHMRTSMVKGQDYVYIRSKKRPEVAVMGGTHEDIMWLVSELAKLEALNVTKEAIFKKHTLELTISAFELEVSRNIRDRIGQDVLLVPILHTIMIIP